MDVFQFVQIAGFALAFFMAGYNLGKRKKPPKPLSGYKHIIGLTVYR